MAKELKVFALNQGDGTRRIVASPTKSRAATLLGVKGYYLDTHGGPTEDAEEKELALSDPGAVWAMRPNGKKWTKVADSKKAEALPSHGGKRPGAGKPLIGPGPSKQRGFRMDDENYARFMKLGGTKFLRKVVASGLDLTSKEWADLEKLGGVAWLRKQMAAGLKELKG
ncbi:hypothetical protein PAERUG_P40_Scotland_4_VIM_2_09_12_04237 [Pseudomonas aeruginosa]|nr:hypothetical protein [Pseudomonas aeruginosa]CRN71090.1 hypothetical protein PAERUG_P40_Scotland_4_VIM_2_09_12_04237 [Pseudomonas aeruginosa]